MTISPRRRAWLGEQVARWQRDGLVDEHTGSAILGRYESGSRAVLRHLMITLGVVFLIVGVLSLVAANLEWAGISPLGRFGIVAAAWLACTVTAAALPGGNWKDAAHLAAAGTYGAVVFQAAQSLQVPAESPGLLAAWALGALAYAYANRSVSALIVGIGAFGGWYLMVTFGGDGIGALPGTAVSGAVFTAVAALHRRGAFRGFAVAWRYLGALATVVSLFIAALPGISHRPALTPPLAAGFAVFLLVALGAVRLDRSRDRQIWFEMAAAGAAALAVLVLMALPETRGALYSDTLSGGQILRLVLGTVFYLAYAIWVAAVGAIRGNHRITGLATAALVVFVVVQSFGVFNELMSAGATFLFVGLVLLAVGWGADRGRRRLLASVGRGPGGTTA